VADDSTGRFRPLPVAEVRDRLTRGQLRASGYEHLARGVYRPAGGPGLTHGDRIAVVRAALVRPVVLGGISAAWALGAELASADEPVVVVAVPPTPDPRPREGLVVRRCALGHDEVVRTALGWATTPVRTAADLLLLEPRVRAVATADAVLRAGGLPPSAVAEALGGRRGARGVAAARGLVPLLDPRAESPRESELRLLLHDARLPAPEVQLEVRDEDGDFVARLDLGWAAQRVGLEYDGAQHRERARHSRDLARHNRLRALGWLVLQVDAAALARPAALLAQLRGLLA